MENIENGCVILKKKEYDELIAKAQTIKKENSDKKIHINWRYFYNYPYSNFPLEVSGDFILGNKLYYQITRILLTITEKFNKECSDLYKTELTLNKTKIITNFKNKTKIITNFKNLPWYKRLFFKEKYIKFEDF
jgi:hypothetical protein